MKIVLFVRSLDVGGSQRQLVHMANGLARRGHEVTIVTFYGDASTSPEKLSSGVRTLQLEKSGRWDVWAPLSRYRRMLVSERPDVVYAFHPPQAVVTALLRPLQFTRLVVGVRGMRTDNDWLSGLFYWLEARISRRSDLIIANSHSLREYAIERGFPAERTKVIPNGIDTDAIRPDPAAGRTLRQAWGISDREFLIGLVARLDPMKDHRTFLDAAAKYARHQPDARFVCVGGGPAPYRQMLEQHANDLGLADRVVWAGELPNAVGAYNAFDMATLSSFSEGLPNVVGEAMACERSVVSTNVGDVAAIIGEYGEVVPPRRPDLLCEGWARLRERLRREPTLGRAGREFIVANYGVETMVQRTEDMLCNLRKVGAR